MENSFVKDNTIETPGNLSANPRIDDSRSISTKPSINNQIFWMKAKFWWIIIALHLLLQIILCIVLQINPTWAQQGDGNSWKGGLLSIKDSDDPNIDTISYESLADDACDFLNNYGACEMFEDLRDAGELFIFFETLNLVMLFLWLLRVLFSLCERICLPDWFAYIWPSLGTVFHLIGVVVWIELVQADFESCDEISRKSRENVCARGGPALAVFATITQITLAIIFVTVWKKRLNSDVDLLEKQDNSFQSPDLKY